MVSDWRQMNCGELTCLFVVAKVKPGQMKRMQ